MHAPATAQRLVTGFLDLLFPPRCLGCGREGPCLCPECLAAAPRLQAPASGPQGPLQGIVAPFAMEGVARKAVHGLKYQNLRSVAPLMGGLLTECLRAQGVSGDILVPVPLHPRRLRQRGYNQAELLAREVGRRLGVPVDRGVLKRVRHSPPQARAASREERHANVAGAFQARRELRGLRVLVLDDVTTTGATLAACAAVLQAAGAESVWGVAFAKEL